MNSFNYSIEEGQETVIRFESFPVGLDMHTIAHQTILYDLQEQFQKSLLKIYAPGYLKVVEDVLSALPDNLLFQYECKWGMGGDDDTFEYHLNFGSSRWNCYEFHVTPPYPQNATMPDWLQKSPEAKTALFNLFETLNGRYFKENESILEEFLRALRQWQTLPHLEQCSKTQKMEELKRLLVGDAYLRLEEKNILDHLTQATTHSRKTSRL